MDQPHLHSKMPDSASGHSSRAPDPTEFYEVPASDKAVRIVEILEQYLEDLKAGRAPNREELLGRYPELGRHSARRRAS